MNRRTTVAFLALALAFVPAHSQRTPPQPQQVILTGGLNVPTDVVTQDNQWSPLIRILTTDDLALFIEDPSNPTWLRRNAEDFVDRGRYTIAVVSFYKTRDSCRADQVRAGRGGSAGWLACNDYRYQIRHVTVDSFPSTITLGYSAMVFAGGFIDESSVRHENRTRGLQELDADTQKALTDANAIVSKQAHSWVARQRNLP
jgi:hypothetical protein